MRAAIRLAIRIGRDCRAASMVEFALISPALVVALLGLFDMSYNIYTSSLLNGAIQQAARDSTIEGAAVDDGTVDRHVGDTVRRIVPSAEIAFDRKAYADFSEVGQPEDFTDVNRDGRCNEGEPFEDVNGNAAWDEDRGRAGAGGARDAVIYLVTVTYDRQFPLSSMLGIPPQVSTTARTVLRNQPYEAQERSVTVEHCQ